MNSRNNERDRGFADAWNAFKKDDATLSAPASVHDAVMEAWERHQERQNPSPDSARRRDGYLFRRQGYLMIAAAVALMVGAAVVNREDSQPPATPVQLQNIVESEPLQLVRVRMPREALGIFGVSLIEPQAASVVDVELVIADDGSAHSIRSVTIVVDGGPQE